VGEPEGLPHSLKTKKEFMQGKKVYELARECDMDTAKMKRILREVGFPVLTHMKTLSAEAIEAVLAKLNSQAEPSETKTEPQKTVDVEMEKKNDDSAFDEVIYFSPSRSHDIAYKKETYFANSSKIKDPAQSIKFNDYEYRTSDPEKIEFIKNTRSFKIRSTSYPHGKIRIVTEEQLAKLRTARRPRVTEIKSTGEKTLTDDLDMSQFNVVPI